MYLKKILTIALVLLLFFSSNFHSVGATQSKFIFFGIGVNCQNPNNDDYAPDIVTINNEFFNKTIATEYESHLILGQKATKDTILEGFSWLVQNTKSSDTVLIYIAAHGNDNGEFSFFSAEKLKVWVSEIKEYLKLLNCNVIIIIDTCHSGAFVRDCSDLNKNFLIIASCKAEEYSWGWYFFDSLIEVLSKIGDLNNDGIICSKEVLDSLPPRLAKRISIQHLVSSENIIDIPLLKA